MNKLIILCVLILIHSCDTDKTFVNKQTNLPLKIAISKAEGSEGYLQYIKWVKSIDSNIITYSLYSLSIDSALKVLDNCNGVIISGGPDVFPGNYGKAYDTIRCGIIDKRRDSLEFAIIDRALENKQAILGICRGLQILNVYFGGSLIIDIPTDFDTLVKHRCIESDKCYHKINISEQSHIHNIIGSNTTIVNSNHHQGINLLAKNLKAVAFSEDGLIEAIELKKPKNKQFLLGVQWHPERLDEQYLAGHKILEGFIEAIKKPKFKAN